MTEEEKMRQGLLYDANYDEELLAERRRCKELCFEYNRLSPAREDERRALIRRQLGRTGRRFEINAPFWCDYGRNVEIGENFYANHNCVILDGAKVVFGDNVFVGPNCGFYTAGHPLDAGLRGRGLEYAKPIAVGDNVWIGAGVSVLPGVTIGSGSVVGAGSVVNRDIPAGVVAAGNPCRVIRPIAETDRPREEAVDDSRRHKRLTRRSCCITLTSCKFYRRVFVYVQFFDTFLFHYYPLRGLYFFAHKNSKFSKSKSN